MPNKNRTSKSNKWRVGLSRKYLKTRYRLRKLLSPTFKKHHRIIGFLVTLLGLLITAVSYPVNKSDNYPQVQLLLTTKEYRASQALQSLTSKMIINDKSEGFYELRYFAEKQIPKSYNFSNEQRKMLQDYPIFYARFARNMMTGKEVFTTAKFYSLCCNFEVKLPELTQEIEQSKKDVLSKWNTRLFVSGLIVSILGVIIGLFSPKN